MIRAISRSSASTVPRSSAIAAAAASPSLRCAPTCMRSALHPYACSSEVASDDRALFAGDEILLGRELARLLGLDYLGHAAGRGLWVVPELIFASVGSPHAGAGAELGGHFDALAGGVEPRRLAAKEVRV